MFKRIETPLFNKEICKLKAGDEVLLSGVIYTLRDQAHFRMVELINKGKTLPICLRNQIIYYAGPTPAKKHVIGSCGPTTSSRMDSFTPALLKAGLKGMIGKGTRSSEVVRMIKRYSAVYFIAPGGAGAYLSFKVRKCSIAAFKDLGPEAIYELEVKDFPLIVGVDARGKNIYERMTKFK
ncbi:MAG: FumA C-terminus/TtdB family hydratase beta subunit [Candidatus Omnitrophota bacterium]|nr:FumA C-terminus/TtdB family hydratase beta subunit [Candidatus Omnitrophota bacterium]MBU1895100.1 FumA C-terminus/TtdB family hydratase beta subunit [Candidatus Omnitrophota bacterium]